MIDWFNNPLLCFFDIEGHVALDRNPGPGYNTLLLRLITGYMSPSTVPYTIGILGSRAALSNSYVTLTHACQAGRQFVPFL